MIPKLMIQVRKFLNEDMQIKIKDEIVEFNDTESLNFIKDYTSAVCTDSETVSVIVMSFDKSVIKYLVNHFMGGEEIKEEEIDVMYSSMADEVVNTIVGLFIPSLPDKGKGVKIEPPITINDILNLKDLKELKESKNRAILNANIVTNVGTLSISAIDTNIKK